MAKRIKPCPFCGEGASIKFQTLVGGMSYWVECNSCDTKSRTVSIVAEFSGDRLEKEQEAADKAVDNWNERDII